MIEPSFEALPHQSAGSAHCSIAPALFDRTFRRVGRVAMHYMDERVGRAGLLASVVHMLLGVAMHMARCIAPVAAGASKTKAGACCSHIVDVRFVLVARMSRPGRTPRRICMSPARQSRLFVKMPAN